MIMNVGINLYVSAEIMEVLSNLVMEGFDVTSR